MLFLTDERLERVLADDTYPRTAIRMKLLNFCEGRWLTWTPEKILSEVPGRSQCHWSAVIGDLSMAFTVTGEARYLEHALAVLRPLARDWRSMEFLPEISIPFVFGMVAQFIDLQRDQLSSDDLALFRRFMVEMVDYHWADLHERTWGSIERAVWNHSIIGYATVALAGLVLDDHPNAAEWLEVGMARTSHFLDVGVTPAGMTWEGLHYCGYVFKHIGLLMQALDNRGLGEQLVPPGSEHERRLHQVPVWYAHETFPRGKWLQNYNDSHCDPPSPLYGFLMTFARYEPDLCAAVWELLVGRSGLASYGAHGRWSSLVDSMLFYPLDPPDLTAIERLDPDFYCPDVGYLSSRDRWGPDGSVFTFNSGPLLGEIHDHADNNSFTFIAAGEPLVIEAGSGNKPVEGSGSSATGHNLVFIDGLSECIAGGGRGVSGRILGIERTPTHVAAIGDATESYAKDDHNPVRHAWRHTVFVKEPIPYLVTYDDIDKDGREHQYEYLLHVPGGDDHDVDGMVDTLTVRSLEGADAGRVVLLHPARAKVGVEPFTTQAAPFQEHALWRIATRAVNPRFTVLYLPEEVAASLRPETQVELGPDTTTVRLRWPDGTDEITFAAGAESEGIRLPTLTRRRSLTRRIARCGQG